MIDSLPLIQRLNMSRIRPDVKRATDSLRNYHVSVHVRVRKAFPYNRIEIRLNILVINSSI